MPIPEFTPSADKSTLRERAREQIGKAILDGTLVPGEVLDVNAVVEWIGFSRTPVREALIDLQRDGLIETGRNSFTRVLLPDPVMVQPALEALGVIRRGVVESGIPRMEKSAVSAAGKVFGRLRRDVQEQDSTLLVEDMTRLFDVYAQHSGNGLLFTVYEHSVTGLSFRLRVPDLGERLEWSQYGSLFEDLHAATEAGDGAAGSRVTTEIHQVPVRAPHEES